MAKHPGDMEHVMVFCYGGLLDPAEHRELGVEPKDLGEDHLRGYILGMTDDGYHIAQRGPGTIPGRIYKFHANDLHALDTYQGSAYQRRAVVTGKQYLQVYAYVAP